MELTTAVVGGGVVSDVHLNGLQKLPTSDLVAICDLDEDRVREKAHEHDINAYTDMEDMLDREDLDWVHLCTPVQTHLDLAKLAIESGVPVQIEKPVTETIEEAKELERFADHHDVRVWVVHNHDFDPVCRKAREAMERGDLGAIRSVDMLYAGETWPDEVNRGTWAFDLPGGEFEEGLPHPIYVLLNLGGYPENVESIHAKTDRHGTYDRDFDYDGVEFSYRTDEGVLCSGTVLASEIPHKVIQIHGNKASMEIDLVAQTVTTLDRDYESSALSRGIANVDHLVGRFTSALENVRAVIQAARADTWKAERDLEQHYYQFDREAEALLRNDPLPVSLDEGTWTIQIMEIIRSAARSDTESVTAEPPSSVDDTKTEEASTRT